MAKVDPVNILVQTAEPGWPERVVSVLESEHGMLGLNLVGEVTDGDLALSITDTANQTALEVTYRTQNDEPIAETAGKDDDSVRQSLSRFAMEQLFIPLSKQTSRADHDTLGLYAGERPNLEADPSIWLVDNPFLSDLCRRFPAYGNLVRYLCNERGLFLKVGNYPDQRAYWNSTLNGGLPVYKKSDAIHEGTFMLHDMFHFVPVDPVLAAGEVTSEQKSVYVAHRLLSEASTLVLADMVAIADSGLGKAGYDVSKRKIFPVYESIVGATGKAPDVDKLLAANAYFCFTGDSQGFRLLGASEDVLAQYQAKYGTIFRDDFMWNLANLEAMLAERASNPEVEAYHGWLSDSGDFPALPAYTADVTAGDGVDIPRMLSYFRADYLKALNYGQPIDNDRRFKLAAKKYLAGQRMVFARFGSQLEAGQQRAVFDEAYSALEAGDDTSDLLKTANSAVDTYIGSLAASHVLLPHEAALYKFSVPFYPIRFVNYERKNQASAWNSSAAMNDFINVNRPYLDRLLDAVAA